MTLLEYIEQEPGMTQSSLARDLGISAGHMTDLVKRRTDPSYSLALRIISRSGGKVSWKALASTKSLGRVEAWAGEQQAHG